VDIGRRLAQRMLEAVRAVRVPWEGGELSLTVSVGVAAPEPEDQVEEWMERADRRLYEAKRGGRDQAA
jgi:diguanylate cyclase (GGDEF)-like protein